MANILIWRKILPGNELDIFGHTDYHNLYSHLNQTQNGICPNWGNKLWFQGLYSTINTDDNTICFRQNERPEEINERFDLVIYPMANFFGTEYSDAMVSLAEDFAQIKIPVYILACGAQADSYSQLDELIRQIGEPAKRFISSIYNTGGEFALRGEFTKQFFEKLGFPSAVVTGCPSMYQLGPDFSVTTAKVPFSRITPIFNGRLPYLKKLLSAFPGSVLLDQDKYMNCLYQPNYLADKQSLKAEILFHNNFDVLSAKLLGQKQIVMIVDMNDWSQYLKTTGFNYSFGTRIHGNIMSILSGIPATVAAIDSRTREMAEFFDIPYSICEKNHTFSVSELESLYMAADYSKFNETYKRRFLTYETFLRDHGIANHVNSDNLFFQEPNQTDFIEHIQNQEDFLCYYHRLKKHMPLLTIGKFLISLKNHLQ